jgi:hypothetical protein
MFKPSTQILSLSLVSVIDNPITHVKAFRYTDKVLQEVRLLSMRQRAASQHELVATLSRSLDRLPVLGAKRVRAWWLVDMNPGSVEGRQPGLGLTRCSRRA